MSPRSLADEVKINNFIKCRPVSTCPLLILCDKLQGTRTETGWLSGGKAPVQLTVLRFQLHPPHSLWDTSATGRDKPLRRAAGRYGPRTGSDLVSELVCLPMVRSECSSKSKNFGKSVSVAGCLGSSQFSDLSGEVISDVNNYNLKNYYKVKRINIEKSYRTQ